MMPLEVANSSGNPLLRSDLYALLASLLTKPPSAAGLRQLAELTAAPEIPAQLNAILEQLKAVCGGIDAELVQREYEDLFIGLGRGEIVPYASWYEEKLLMAAPLARLRADLAVLNLQRRPGACEPEDHAGALCETMVLILSQPEITVRQQADFFKAHLSPWLIRFFRDLQKARTAVFYRPVGRLGEHFMLLEKELLQEPPIEEV
jgi:TorA maturation chaperone TorD